jgi:hypothetical protein
MSEQDAEPVPPDDDDLVPPGSGLLRNTTLWLVLLATAGVGALAYQLGLHPSAEELIAHGNVCLLQRDGECALKAYQEALEERAGDVDAHRGIANAHGVNGDDRLKREWLKKALALPRVSPRQKAVLQDLLAKHHLAEAVRVEAANPQAYEAELTRASELQPKGKAHVLLAQHLMETGEELARVGEAKAAADAYSRVGALNVAQRIRAAAVEKGVPLRLPAFQREFPGEFAAKHEAALTQTGEWDPRRRRFLATATITVDPPEEGADPPTLREVHLDALGAAKEGLLDLLARIAGGPKSHLLSLPEDLVTWELAAESDGWVERPTTYAATISTDWESGSYLIFLVRHTSDLGWRVEE